MERLEEFGGFIFMGIVMLILNLCGVSLAAKPEDKINPEYNITTTTLIVHWYKTEEQLQESLQDYEIAGITECEMRPDFNTSFCEMWLVTPVDLADYYSFDTIGHELYHALAGDFHE